MRKFDELNKIRRKMIAEKFVLPTDTSNVEVDEFYRPFIQDGGRMMCTVRNTNFHVHGNRQNR